MKKRSSQSGFTLIELLVVVAIIGILSAIAYPSYISKVRKSRRADAKSVLLQAANREERYYTTQYEYASSMTDLGYAGAFVTTENDAYRIKVDNADSTGFHISAKSKGDQQNDACDRLTINHLGEKTANGDTDPNSAASQTCW